MPDPYPCSISRVRLPCHLGLGGALDQLHSRQRTRRMLLVHPHCSDKEVRPSKLAAHLKSDALNDSRALALQRTLQWHSRGAGDARLRQASLSHVNDSILQGNTTAESSSAVHPSPNDDKGSESGPVLLVDGRLLRLERFPGIGFAA